MDTEIKQQSGAEGIFMAIVFVIAVFMVGVATGFMIRVFIGG